MSDNKIPNEQELWNVLDDSAKPVKEASPAPVKAGRKLDGFFFACMAGVAAVSVAATLVIGGMLGGIFTATEGSAIAVAYALILSFIYRNITIKDLPGIIFSSP